MIGPVSTPLSTKWTVQPAILTPRVERLPLRVHAREGGQQGRVDVDDAAGERGQQLVAQHAHEPGQHDQVDLVRAQARASAPGRTRRAPSSRGDRRRTSAARRRAPAPAPRSRGRWSRRPQLRAGPSSPRRPRSISACRLVPLPETSTPTFIADTCADELHGRVGRVGGGDLADREHLLAGALAAASRASAARSPGTHTTMPMPMLNVRRISARIDVAAAREQLEDRRHRPAAEVGCAASGARRPATCASGCRPGRRR